jgi:predicted GNAT superfamily acetyltransferase
MRAAGEPAVLLSVGAGDQPVAHPDRDIRNGALIEIPSDFQSIKQRSMDLALSWRMASRTAFETALAARLVASDARRTGAYLMEPLA